MKESARSGLSRRAQDWCSGTPLASIADTYVAHLTDRGYASSPYPIRRPPRTQALLRMTRVRSGEQKWVGFCERRGARSSQ